MKTSKDLFDLIRSKASDQRLVLGKWNEYTFQYESGIGFTGLNSRFTVWHYSIMILDINYKQLTVNDDKKVKVESQIEDGIWVEQLMDAIEQDQTIVIGGVQQLWRITIGGIIARNRAKRRSKMC